MIFPPFRPRARLALIVALLLLIPFYLWSYLTYEATPNPAAQYPTGWWGWFDQGEYLKSIKGFALAKFESANFLYPPLYALLAAPFWRVMPDHSILIPDITYFLIYFGVLLWVSRRFYGIGLPAVVCGCMLIFIPIATTTQWIIPWTTSLQSAIISILIAIVSYGEARDKSFRLVSRRDWLLFGAFFICYGALAPTRPLDLIVWFPFALNYFIRTLLACAKAAQPNRRLFAGARVSIVAVLCGSVFVTFYVAFNELMFGAPFGAYAKLAGGNGYFVGDVPEKIFSIFFNSWVFYGESGQALFEKIPIFGVIFSVCAVSIFMVGGLRRWIILTAFFNFIIYMPYGDLLPTGLFRYFNLHYFKWAYPWLAVIATGQAASWLTGRVHKRRGWCALAASIAILALGFGLGFRPAEKQVVADNRTAENRSIQLNVPRRKVDFIDVNGLQGGFSDFTFGSHELYIDGRMLSHREFRLLPVSGGARILFIRPIVLDRVDLRPAPGIMFVTGQGRSVLASPEFGLSCKIRSCVEPVRLGPLDGKIVFDFRAGGNVFGADMADWGDAETWGRWTKTENGRLDFFVETRGPVRIETTAGPLLGGSRKKAKVQFIVNGCVLVDQVVEVGGNHLIGGVVKGACLRPNGAMHVEWRTDAALRPVDLGINADLRRLGMGVENLTISPVP